MVDAIINQYHELLHRVDAWFNQCLALCRPSIACAEGCSACCRGLFDITLLDAYVLQTGFQLLHDDQRSEVLKKVHERLSQLQQQWPELQPPYILNNLPHQRWLEMPEDDLTPCPLLGADGCCLVYDYRPLTCRLHGIPQVDLAGVIFCDSCCTLNFNNDDPLNRAELHGPFSEIFSCEVELLSRFSKQLLGFNQAELDTFIPLALLIDFTDLEQTNL